MSLQLLASTIEELPWALRDQVYSYAETVKRAMPAIFSQTETPFNQAKADKIIYLAGIKKLRSIINSNHWILYNSSQMLNRQQVEKIKIGGQDFSKGSDLTTNLRKLNQEVEAVIIANQLQELLMMDYSTLVSTDL